MRLNKRTTILIASLAAVLCMCGLAQASELTSTQARDAKIEAQLSAIHAAEQANISITKLMRRMSNPGKGTIMIATSNDDWEPLAVSGTDGWVLTFDTGTGLPVWAAPDTSTFSGTLATTNGGTGKASWTQGDVPFYTSGTALSVLAKSARPLMSIGNTGSSNAPAYRPIKGLLYSSLTESAAHTGATAAATTVMPATAEGTAATDIGTANMLAGAVFDYKVYVDATGDADGDETLTVNILFGAQVVGTSGALAVDGATDFVLTGTVNLEAAGASVAGNYFSINNSYPGVGTTTAETFTAFDTTATQAFIIQLDWGGTTDAADTAKVQMATLELVNFD